MSGSFRIEGTRALLHSYVFDVERRIVAHEGATFERDVVLHPGAVAILALDDHQRVGLVRQYRATVDRVTLEIPAGTQDVAGESPLATAQRELLEELGCSGASWRELGRFMSSPGWTDQIMTIFEARELTMRARDPEGPEESAAQVLWLTREELRVALAREDAIDSTMAVALHRVFGTFFDLI
ncbi:MAG TPA: NUDIX hydrolase [Acidimicrobiales bacterium]|nr:NUDIX hydrolase [Acidimicrobiales bacterium]